MRAALLQYRYALWTCAGLLCVLVAAAVLYPLFAKAKHYSGPGLIGEALLLNRDGTRAANRKVRLTLRGRSGAQGEAMTNASGQLKIDRNESWVDGVEGFLKVGTVKGSDGKYRPVFLEGVDQRSEDRFRAARATGRLDLSWR